MPLLFIQSHTDQATTIYCGHYRNNPACLDNRDDYMFRGLDSDELVACMLSTTNPHFARGVGSHSKRHCWAA